MKNYYKGKHILITGGAGYIGQLLLDKLLEFDPAVVRILDSHENGLFKLRQEYSGEASNKLRFLLGDIRNLDRLQYAFRGIDVVIHTASYKHVLECEHNPIDAVETNINGTSNIVQAAIFNNVEKVLFTSSDKAANPSNTMGATKLLAEKLMIAANAYSAHSTIFACCRFGNVIRSSGSVVPLFEMQMKEGKSITITDPEMTRFLISSEEAVELVLQSCFLAQGGEVFISKMQAMRIGDLADAMMNKYGAVSQQIIGKKAGEKMYEELMTEEEMSRAYEKENMYVIAPSITSIDQHNYEGFDKVTAVNNSHECELLTREEILRLIE